MNTPKDIEVLKEKLAAIEHERWSDWQAWCHKVLRENCQSPELEKVLERWDRQIATPYAELSEAEKQSDRDQVDRYWHLITTLVDEVRAERDREIVKWIKKHSRFADPQIPKDESDKRWEIHYTGYREAVNDLITHLTK